MAHFDAAGYWQQERETQHLDLTLFETAPELRILGKQSEFPITVTDS
jgi:hypothetical protein